MKGDSCNNHSKWNDFSQLVETGLIDENLMEKKPEKKRKQVVTIISYSEKEQDHEK